MALFNMADQFNAGVDGSLDLNESDSRKRPLDGAGDGRPSYKRSNLGGMYLRFSFFIDVRKFCLVLTSPSLSWCDASLSGNKRTSSSVIDPHNSALADK